MKHPLLSQFDAVLHDALELDDDDRARLCFLLACSVPSGNAVYREIRQDLRVLDAAEAAPKVKRQPWLTPERRFEIKQGLIVLGIFLSYVFACSVEHYFASQ